MNIFSQRLCFDDLWTLMRFLLGAFFMLSGMFKFLSLSSFTETLAGYNFLSEFLVLLLTYGIPAIEVGFGLLLFIAWRVPEVSLSLLVVVFIFTVAAFLKYQNGQIGDCGCFGEVLERENNWRLFVENTGLMILLGILHFKGY